MEFRYGTGATYCLSAVLMTEVEQYLRSAQLRFDVAKEMLSLSCYPGDHILQPIARN